MPEPLVGRALQRREDPALLTGRVEYTDDVTVDGLAHVALLRSQYGHARIEDIDPTGALALDGVQAVFTGGDIAASDSPGELTRPNPLSQGCTTPLPILATDTVRYVGEAVAAVVAEDRYTATDALDRIAVQYDRQPAVVDPYAALEDRAPTVQPGATGNVAYDIEFGDQAAVDSAFDAAADTASLDLHNQRVIGDPMEPRAVLAEPDGERLMVTMSTQTPHREQAMFADVLGLDPHQVDVVAPAVGGGFGIKGARYADECLIAWCARELDRPVKWVARRTEGHAADYQSRDIHLDGSLALAADGEMLALRLEAVSNVGAYYVFPPSLFANVRSLLSGQYSLPAIAGRARGAFTNTTPTAPYRGAGRPEAIYLIERLVRQAATELDMDPVELRRRNQIPPEAFPYETPLDTVYDSGDYEATMDVALEAAGYQDLRAKQAEVRNDGRYVGIGISCFVENTAASPGMGETSRVRVASDGSVTAYLGTHDHGQGHATTFGQLLADELGVAYEAIEIVEGDTRDLESGTGTFGSRSAALGGAAMVEAADAVREQAREAAAEALEVNPADLDYAAGTFHVTGAPDRSVSLQALAAETELEATADYDPPNHGFSFGTHVAAVEVDPETGEVEIDRYIAVDDCGVVINPLIVEGQIHGGVTQGVAQALREGVEYDDTGTLQTGSLQEYALPKAIDVPEFETHATETPSPHNPLGVKGTGESGTIAATPAIVNAVVDALAPLGVVDVPLPMTPETVWKTIEAAR
ncbi:MAG: xanthine dehydrogenase family protein molybdopterin-binding subunit [Halobacteriales archaeon]